VVALWRLRSFKKSQLRKSDFSLGKKTRAVDKDIDMRRSTPRPSSIAHHFSRLLRWMMPQSNAMGPPMRSVARELEEDFPSNDY